MTEPLDLFPDEAAEATPAPDLETLRERAAACTACELHHDTTGTVFGSGPPQARLVMVGEQPGDQEDRQGAPFVGPAGRLLDEALESAGIARDDAYVTNAVKHFNFRYQGKRRIHETPKAGHIKACRPWLDAELALVRPQVLLTLGATAGKALLGSSFRITAERGEPRPWNDLTLVPTIHPSAILRADPGRGQDRDEMMEGFVADLRRAGELLHA
ncbi:UdgX family uracil-DNA binding protein [Actinomycetospora chibensis]|uniref:Type-4 uracil-DNA glycosylase n=1 Tax=Actinomycetospora chibensis TaxID=663606 RepID=A0ABV9RFY0_9PSEU|nr:UdgX family uracil-DNA binding protein [Actinomycetospora chibensis]MDD7922099.1 UdgX family uracil-DNA binding protein [Actinomycetospora chibensis]